MVADGFQEDTVHGDSREEALVLAVSSACKGDSEHQESDPYWGEVQIEWAKTANFEQAAAPSHEHWAAIRLVDSSAMVEQGLREMSK